MLERVAPELRLAASAMAASAIGTAAGIFADSSFALRRSVNAAMYRLLGPAFDVIGGFPNGQLMLSAFLDRLPVLLLVGLAVGFVLRYLRFRRLLLGCVLVWPAMLLLPRLASWLVLAATDIGTAFAFLSTVMVPAGAAYVLQYGVLFAVIHFTGRLLARPAHKPASM